MKKLNTDKQREREIENRAKRATPTPDCQCGGGPGYFTLADGRIVTIAPTDSGDTSPQEFRDAEFFAHARDDVYFLLLRLARLRLLGWHVVLGGLISAIGALVAVFLMSLFQA